MEFEEDFLAEEERCGYTVSSDMKKVWAIELDLLEQFQKVCEKYSLTYYFSGGSMLGAVRHKGFIPWDDDIDINMMRQDYEKLCEVAENEFSHPYFFQTHYTDEGYTRAHAQLRNSETTGILNSELGCCRFNQGIFIDIFPMDKLPKDQNKLKKMRNRIFLCRKLLALTCDYAVNTPKTLLKNIFHFAVTPFVNTKKLYKKLEETSRQYNGEDADFVAPISTFPKQENLIFPIADYDKTITVPFENTFVPIPAGYDDLLKIQYGDYMTMRKENSYHGNIIFDTEKSYTEYLK